MLWANTITFTITGTPPNGEYLVNYGVSEAFAPFFLNQMVETMSSTINNNTVSMNVKDMIASFLRVHDNRELNRYNGMTTTMVDRRISNGPPIPGILKKPPPTGVVTGKKSKRSEWRKKITHSLTNGGRARPLAAPGRATY